MTNHRGVWVRCIFRRGAFSGERVFAIRLDGERGYCGVAPFGYCLGPDRKPVTPNPEEGVEIEGLLEGLRIGAARPGIARVELPDGEVYEVPERLLVADPRWIEGPPTEPGHYWVMIRGEVTFAEVHQWADRRLDMLVVGSDESLAPAEFVIRHMPAVPPEPPAKEKP